MKLTKAGALRTILMDSRSNRVTRTSYNRVVKALGILEIEPEEWLGILNCLEYTGQDGLVRDRYLKKP